MADQYSSHRSRNSTSQLTAQNLSVLDNRSRSGQGGANSIRPDEAASHINDHASRRSYQTHTTSQYGTALEYPPGNARTPSIASSNYPRSQGGQGGDYQNQRYEQSAHSNVSGQRYPDQGQDEYQEQGGYQQPREEMPMQHREAGGLTTRRRNGELLLERPKAPKSTKHPNPPMTEAERLEKAKKMKSRLGYFLT
ncbi:hypothetical protein B7494_g1380 [Chlorociboria aeruginascens]|nr:hypothetical protein B7494_g1380 [Chlorociboria aeruginascens]